MKDLMLILVVIVLGLLVYKFVLPKFKNKIQEIDTELLKRKQEK